MNRITRRANSRPLEKHRLAVEDYAVDFADVLSTGETLSSAGSVTVTIPATGADTDVSSEFNPASVQIVGTTVAFRLAAAGSGQQDEDRTYYLRVQPTTSNGRQPVSVHRLYVSEVADETAP